ncbi:hypothetical protein GCM10027215_32660 [Nocardioides zeae]
MKRLLGHDRQASALRRADDTDPTRVSAVREVPREHGPERQPERAGRIWEAGESPAQGPLR